MSGKSIPGWTSKIDEISNGVYKVTLTNIYGNRAEVVDNATNETIEKAKSDAFDIEKQISKNWNLFLFNLCLQSLNTVEVKSKDYNDKAFGSWFVERNNFRMIYDGKDSVISLQNKNKDKWIDLQYFDKEGLSYSNFVNLINILTEVITFKNITPLKKQKWWNKIFSL